MLNWEDERVLDADLAGQAAERIRLSRCELHRVVLTGAQLRGLALVDVLAIDCELSGAVSAQSVPAPCRAAELSNDWCGDDSIESEAMFDWVECKLDEANLRLARADHVEMIAARWSTPISMKPSSRRAR